MESLGDGIYEHTHTEYVCHNTKAITQNDIYIIPTESLHRPIDQYVYMLKISTPHFAIHNYYQRRGCAGRTAGYGEADVV